jgi:hypothetical protein
MSRTEQGVRRIATALPHVECGIACKGTSLESTTFTVKRKVFVFIRQTGKDCELRLKLGGKWVKKAVPADRPPPELKAWLEESYAAFAQSKK